MEGVRPLPPPRKKERKKVGAYMPLAVCDVMCCAPRSSVQPLAGDDEAGAVVLELRQPRARVVSLQCDHSSGHMSVYLSVREHIPETI